MFAHGFGRYSLKSVILDNQLFDNTLKEMSFEFCENEKIEYPDYRETGLIIQIIVIGGFGGTTGYVESFLFHHEYGSFSKKVLIRPIFTKALTSTKTFVKQLHLLNG